MKVAICICTCQRDSLLARLLDALSGIELGALLPEQVEILVVNNRPNANTRHLCDEAGAKLPVALQYVEEPIPGVASARNRAVSTAMDRDADFVAFIDDDDLPDSDWLVQLLKVQAETGSDIIAGNRRFAGNPPPWTEKPEQLKAKKGGDKKVGSNKIVRSSSTCNVLIGKVVLSELAATGKVFDSRFNYSGGEDKDFFIRAAQAGASMAFAEKSLVTLFNETERYSYRGVMSRGFKAGCSKMNITRTHGHGRQVPVLALSSLAKLLVCLLLMPLALVNRAKGLRQSYRLGKASGMLFFSLTGRSSRYYGK